MKTDQNGSKVAISSNSDRFVARAVAMKVCDVTCKQKTIKSLRCLILFFLSFFLSYFEPIRYYILKKCKLRAKWTFTFSNDTLG